MTRQFLVVVRAGDRSLHRSWLAPERNFDIAVDYYGSTPFTHADQADHYRHFPGGKWPGLHSFLSTNAELVDQYDAVWLPDDDIETDSRVISLIFDLHMELGLSLSQPALTRDSYFSHLLVLQHAGLSVRWTTFVEVMAPVFSRQALKTCLPTFIHSATGWGLDLVWPELLNADQRTLAILDCLPVKHTRPVGGGDLYAKMGVDPFADLAAMAGLYGEITNPYENVDALDQRFVPVPREQLARRALAGIPRPEVQSPLPGDSYALGAARRGLHREQAQPTGVAAT